MIHFIIITAHFDLHNFSNRINRLFLARTRNLLNSSCPPHSFTGSSLRASVCQFITIHALAGPEKRSQLHLQIQFYNLFIIVLFAKNICLLNANLNSISKRLTIIEWCVARAKGQVHKILLKCDQRTR